MSRVACIFAALLTLGAVAVAPVRAQVYPVPQTMNYQGRLANPSGNPVPDGAYSIRFSLWTAATGGTEKWNQTAANVTVRNGVFSVALTGMNAATFTTDLWLETKIGSDAALAPRQKLASVAYAFKADSVKDGSVTLDSLAPDVLNFNNIGGTINANQIADASITGSKIAAGTVTAANLAPDVFSNLGGMSSAPLPSLQGAATTGDIPFAVAVRNGFAYVLSNYNHALQVYNVANSAAPVLVSTTPTNTHPCAILLNGNFAYVLNNSAKTLQIFNIANPAAPALVSTTPTSNAPRAMALKGNALCISGNAFFQVFDVSDPGTPQSRRVFSLTSPMNTVTIVGDYAYTAEYEYSHWLYPAYIFVYNLTNPNAPTYQGAIACRSYVVGLAAKGSALYCLSGSDRTLDVYDVSNPTNPQSAKSLFAYSGSTGLSVKDNFLYVTSVEQGVTMYSLESPYAPKALTSVYAGPLPFGVDVDGNRMCAVSGTSNQLLSYDFLGRNTQSSLFVAGGANVNGTLNVAGQGWIQGNLGLGTTVPQSALQVSGQAAGNFLAPGVHIGMDSNNAHIELAAKGSTDYSYIDFTNPYEDFKARVIFDHHENLLNIIAPTVRVTGGFQNASDRRYKQNIADLPHPLEMLLGLRGVSYEWRQDILDTKFAAGKQLGFIAQEVEKIFPELVGADSKGYKSVNYIGIIPVVVEAVKAQNQRMETLSKANAELKAKNAELEARLERIEAALKAQK